MIKKVINQYKKLKIIAKRKSLKNKFRTDKYWDFRYFSYGNSGSGSYNRLAEFKAKIINSLLVEYNIKSIVELGCGDGNQLSLINYPAYTGFDISKEAIRKCNQIFKNDASKKFYIYRPEKYQHHKYIADMAISLDVIYHVVEDNLYELYLNHLFNLARKIVIIYSWNFNDHEKKYSASYIKPRKFTDTIENLFPDWKLERIIKNE
jgi:SAM-dependent methyltransferase